MAKPKQAIKALSAAVARLEATYVMLEGVCRRIQSSRPHDNPAEYRSVAQFENAWAVHFDAIEAHQRAMHDWDEAVAAVQHELQTLRAPDFLG